MICVTLNGRTRTCGPASGGVSNIAICDPEDLIFTQAAPVAGAPQQYSAVARRSGATGGVLKMVAFKDKEAEYTFQRADSVNPKYTHNVITQVDEVDHSLTQFLMELDAASYCCGLLVIVRLNTGKILVLGEKHVTDGTTATEIPRFKMEHGDTDGTSGKTFDNFNGGNLKLKGDYSRPAIYFSGAWTAIMALAA